MTKKKSKYFTDINDLEKEKESSVSGWTKQIYNYKVNEIRLLMSGSRLNFLERGKILHEFKERTGETYEQMSSLFGRVDTSIKREVQAHKRSQEYGIDMDSHPDVSPTVMMKALRYKTKEDAEIYMDSTMEYPNIDYNKLTSIMKGHLTIEEYRKELKEKYESELDDLNRLESDLKEKNRNKLEDIEKDIVESY